MERQPDSTIILHPAGGLLFLDFQNSDFDRNGLEGSRERERAASPTSIAAWREGFPVPPCRRRPSHNVYTRTRIYRLAGG